MPDAVDLSRWVTQSGLITPEQVACLRRQGIRRVIIGTRGNRAFAEHARTCREGGLDVEAYVYLYWAEAGTAQAQSALDTIGATQVDTIWVDVEFKDDDNPFPGTGGVDQVLTDVYARLGAKADGIYTSQVMWGRSGLGAKYADKRLWDASFVHGEQSPCEIAGASQADVARATGNERALLRPFVPYGGFERREVVQWHGSVTLCGLNVDLDYCEEDDDAMQRLNGIASYWNDRDLAEGEYAMSLAVDFPALSATASWVELEIFLDPSSRGRLVVMDGDGSYAGQAGTPWGFRSVVRARPYGQQLKLRVEGGPVKTHLIGILGHS